MIKLEIPQGWVLHDIPCAHNGRALFINALCFQCDEEFRQFIEKWLRKNDTNLAMAQISLSVDSDKLIREFALLKLKQSMEREGFEELPEDYCESQGEHDNGGQTFFGDVRYYKRKLNTCSKE